MNNHVDRLFWTLYFDGSKSNDGAGVGCILVSPENEKTMHTDRLEFDCTNNVSKYELLVWGLQKLISLDVKYLKVFND